MPGQLLERERDLEVLDAELAKVLHERQGRLVLIGGEAGIGKSELVETFCHRVMLAARTRILRGVCDALDTPRAAGAILDIAAQTRGELARAMACGAAPAALLRPLLMELSTPTVVVLEDLHWADSSTLDTFRLLARRLDNVPALIIATYRDQLLRTDPLQVLLGELPVGVTRRIAPQPLSVAAVAALGGLTGDDASRIVTLTGGNPFFVTELIATDGDSLPLGVRDAVLARVGRLSSDARRLLEAVAISPGQTEPWLLQALAPDEFAALEECTASGMLRAEGPTVAFRHELAREAVLATLPADRALELNSRALGALVVATPPASHARLAHHAMAIGDASTVLRHAPRAGDHAAAVGAHREAAAHYGAALRFAESMPEKPRARLYEKRSYECYLTGQFREAIVARREALAAHRSAGRRLEQGDAHRWISRFSWFEGDNAVARSEADAAVALLGALEPGTEFAMALSNKAQLCALAADVDGARQWGRRAIALAEKLGDVDTLVHALNNVGTAEFGAGDPAGEPKLRRSLALALEAGMHEHVARAHTNLGCQLLLDRRYGEADAVFADGVAYCAERDLGSWETYMQSWQARSALEQGEFDLAARCAQRVMARSPSPPSMISALVVIALLRARRGDADAWPPLEQAQTLADEIGESQRLEPVAAARAELLWLTDGTDGFSGDPDPDERRPYEAAIHRLLSGDTALMRRAHRELLELGATAAARRAAAELRKRGVSVPTRVRRPRQGANGGELTARELEVLELLGRGLRNSEIAATLVLSERTVAHHVAAIMAKLHAHSRTAAVAKAVALGIGER